MERVRKGTKANYDGVLFTTEEYEKYKKLSETVQTVLRGMDGYNQRKYL